MENNEVNVGYSMEKKKKKNELLLYYF